MISSIKYLLIITLLTGFLNVNAQEIEYPIKEHVAEDGTLYWNLALPMYLSVSSSPNGQGTLLKSEEPAYTNPMYLDSEGPNYIRTRYAVDNETKKMIQPKIEVLMPVIADGTSPSSSVSFLEADASKTGSIQYYGPKLEVQLKASDKLSGVEWLKYSIDDQPFQDYLQNVGMNEEGTHTFSYYAVDYVGNKENTHSSTFVVDLTPPALTHNINGFADDNVIASTSRIYFTGTDELSGVETIYYRFDDEKFKKYDGQNVGFTYLEDGEHRMDYYAVDRVGNRTQDFVFDFYYDKIAPLTASDILGDRFVIDKKIYFSGRTKMKLTAVDNKIGVKEIMYAIDNDDFKAYDQPFYMPNLSGEHTIKYYSIDRLSNKPTGSETYKHNVSLVYLDLTGPDINYSISGPLFETAGTQYISPKTRIQLKGNDAESGLQYISYSVDGVAEETTYSEPFSITTTGEHNIEMFAYDNVNNRNINDTKVFVDGKPPFIIENFSTSTVNYMDGIPVYPPYVTIFLAATDDIVGNDRIYYRINGGTETLYGGPITKLKKDADYTITVRAIDMVGNEVSKTITFKTAAN